MVNRAYSTNQDLEYNVGCAVALAFTPFEVLSCLINRLAIPFSEKIKDKEHLDNMIKEEAQKLKIDKPIKAELVEHDCGSSGPREGYKQVTLGGSVATRIGVKHELMHLDRKHSDYMENPNVISGLKRADFWEALRYVLIDEPQAILYSIIGIKR